jgi:hypothetical protein
MKVRISAFGMPGNPFPAFPRSFDRGKAGKERGIGKAIAPARKSSLVAIRHAVIIAAIAFARATSLSRMRFSGMRSGGNPRNDAT